jgi:hypothetical protein
MSLSDYKTLSPGVCPPALVYFHENQLTYPLAPGEHMDYQFGFTDITTALAADRVLFNSRTHCDAFFLRLPGFLKMMPEYRPNWVVDQIRSKADVLYPGCRFPANGFSHAESPGEVPPLIIWNHRWEFDKNPDDFFQALDEVLGKGVEFRLALLGENSQAIPKAFIGAQGRYGDRIIQYGYVESREDYIKWLQRGSIVISTAQQENFGISVVEAIRYGLQGWFIRRSSLMLSILLCYTRTETNSSKSSPGSSPIIPGFRRFAVNFRWQWADLPGRILSAVMMKNSKKPYTKAEKEDGDCAKMMRLPG